MSNDPFDLIGQVIGGQFRVEALAGDADLSVVYRGRGLDASTPVAIKCLRLPETIPEPLARALDGAFQQAYRVHDKLARGNTNIAQTITCGEMRSPRDGGPVPYLVREWLEGESLAAALAGQHARPMRPLPEVLGLLEGAFDALAFAHAQGQVHLGLNPGNLFVAQRPDGSVTLKVLDFGLARMMNDFSPESPSESHSGCGLRLFLPGYAAPEQIDEALGVVGPRTDVYALALIAMESLAGHALPPNLDQALNRALSAKPGERQADAAELWREMSSVVRPRAASAATLPGGDPRPAVVVGAVGRSRLKVSSEPTLDTAPMRFEAAPPSPEHVPSGMTPAPDPNDPLSIPPSIPSLVPPALSAVASPHPSTSSRPLASLLARRTTVLAGGAAAVLLLGVIGTVVALRSHRSPAAGGAAETSASSAVESAPSALASAPSASGSPSASVSASASSASVEAPPASSQGAAEAAPFAPAVARRALDARRRELAKCRRGKVWGYGLATVTFSNEGSVENVALSHPLAGTPTGACATDALSKAHVAPFAGEARPISYAFYVSPK